MDLNSRQWVYNAAKRDNLPFGVNLGIGDATLLNRYPAEMTSSTGEYLGGWYYALDFGKTVAWSSIQAQNAAFAEMQPLVRDLAARYDNMVNWLEPHEEMCHGVCDLLDDHGPCAKASFHAYLQSKYGTPDALATHWSQPGAFKTWNDVPFPEVATFLGWNSNAIDLTGTLENQLHRSLWRRLRKDRSRRFLMARHAGARPRHRPAYPAETRRFSPAYSRSIRRGAPRIRGSGFTCGTSTTRGTQRIQGRRACIPERQGDPGNPPNPQRIPFVRARSYLRARRRRQRHHAYVCRRRSLIIAAISPPKLPASIPLSVRN